MGQRGGMIPRSARGDPYMRRTTDSTFTDSGVTWPVRHAHAARRDPSGARVSFDLRSTLGYMLRIGAWDTGMKVERVLGAVVRPEAQPVRAQFFRELGMLPDSHPLRHWVDPIPASALTYVASFDFGQLEALRLLQVAPQAGDLIPTNPLLLWLVAWTMAEQSTPPDDAREIASWKRRDLVEWCGGINSKTCVRMLEKFDPPTSTFWIDHLRRQIADADTIALSAQRATPFTATYLVRQQPELRELAAFRAELNDATKTLGPDRVPGLLRDARRIAELLETSAEQSISDCPNAESLQTLHDRLLTDLYAINPPKLRELSRRSASFGRSPVRGTPDIEPIKSTLELLAEGQLMGHCCGMYADQVLDKEIYFYRLLRPQRATLQVAVSKGYACLSELKLRYNEEPSDQTYEFTRAWLRSRRLTPKPK